MKRVSVESLVPTACVVVVTALILGISFEQTGDPERTLRFYVSFLSVATVLAIFALALNLQWGYTGVFNFGVAAFFLIGAYTAAIVTKEPDRTDFEEYIGGYGPDLDVAPFLATDQWFPFLVAVLVSGTVCGVLAFLLSFPTLRLREDYLAITMIGVAELTRRIAIEEQWLVNGTRNLGNIPGPFQNVLDINDYRYVFLAVAISFLLLVFFALERSVRSPWGRVLRALREDEMAAEASGKNVRAYRTQAFVLGAVIMGAGGAMYAFGARAIAPETFTHYFATFIIWTMVIVGGSGNNKGALLGAYVVWGFWQSTLLIQSYDLPDVVQVRIPFIRDMLLGLLIVLALLFMPHGLLPERARVSVWAERAARRVRPPPAGPAPPSAEPQEDKA
ncbi:MAG TPA: branched-chain amino acid ABC transporter permease [Dehalococcoidia bacterium]|nr:branched-chain amino acid ABC transporter permease [Dehalococcoidia bacterium]